MAEIIKFPTGELMEFEETESDDFRVRLLLEANEVLLSAFNTQHEKLMRLSKMSLFERIFKWPYKN